MRCDKVATVATDAENSVSIPAGFSDALRQYILPLQKFLICFVSIPAGFSDALRRIEEIEGADK